MLETVLFTEYGGVQFDAIIKYLHYVNTRTKMFLLT